MPRTFERLLRGSNVPIGVLVDRAHLRIVYAPKGRDIGLACASAELRGDEAAESHPNRTSARFEVDMMPKKLRFAAATTLTQAWLDRADQCASPFTLPFLSANMATSPRCEPR